MNVTMPCPGCEEAIRLEVAPDAPDYTCNLCKRTISMPADTLADGKLRRCIACPSDELFVRKDFPQSLGVGIVVVGFIICTIFWAKGYPLSTYGVLFATALIDLVLYVIVPECLMCYRCGAIYRGAPGKEGHEPFDLETHEKYRQEKIRSAAVRAATADRTGNE